MSRKGHPIRVSLAPEFYNSLMGALAHNAENYVSDGYVAKGAVHLRNNIEKYGRLEVDDGGNQSYSLRFFEKEGEMLIGQFAAYSYAMEMEANETETPNDIKEGADND